MDSKTFKKYWEKGKSEELRRGILLLLIRYVHKLNKQSIYFYWIKVEERKCVVKRMIQKIETHRHQKKWEHWQIEERYTGLDTPNN